MRPRGLVAFLLVALPLACVVLGLGLRIAFPDPVQAQEFDAGAQQIRYRGPSGAPDECAQAVTAAPSFVCNATASAVVLAPPPSDGTPIGFGAFIASAPTDRDSNPGFWRGCLEDFEYVVVPTGGDPLVGPWIIPSAGPGYAGGGYASCADVGTTVVDVWVLNGYLGVGDFCTAQLFVDDPGVCP